MPARAPAPTVVPQELPVSYLAEFVGSFANQLVLTQMKAQGFGDLRPSHGYLIQHLLRAPHSVGQLSKALGITQQAVSKTAAELTRGGYIERAPTEDARLKVLTLSERGHQAVRSARRIRSKLERRLLGKLGKRRAASLRASLLELLEELGGTDAVVARRVPSGEATS